MGDIEKHSETISPTGAFRFLPAAIALLSVAFGTLLIVRTYSVFSQVYDEPAHIAAGMEWLDRGTYTYDALHPPLARVAVAMGPYLAGSRSQGAPDMWSEGNAILDAQGRYQRTLTLARLGVLPFFWLSCFFLWNFVSRRWSPWHAALTILFLAYCPPVLANASVATTDLPLMAMFLWALVSFWRFLEEPSLSTGILACVTMGLAIVCKIPAIPFLVVSCGTLYLCRPPPRERASLTWKALVGAGVGISLIIWAGYRFSVGPILTQGQLTPSEIGDLHRLPAGLTRIFFFRGVPAHEFFMGVARAFLINQSGKPAYIFGHVYNGGHWYFFPVAIAVKTPIPLLALAAAGIACALARVERRAHPVVLVPLVGIGGPLLIAMLGNVNIGLRHVLVIYPLMAVFAAISCVKLWELRGSRWKMLTGKTATILLILWSIVTCVRASPDFIPYFNELAAPYASSILIDSDFDWGQDLNRLSIVLQQLHVESFWFAYEGSADLSRRGLPPFQVLPPKTEPSGWIAISEYKYKTLPQNFGWLEAYTPVRIIGKTIRLYYLAPPTHTLSWETSAVSSLRCDQAIAAP